MVFLAMWLPATNHCLLENVSFAEIDHCCTAEKSTPEKSGSSHDCMTCNAVENVSYKFEQDNAFTFGLPILFALLLQPDVESDSQSFVPIENFARPDLSSSWQFVFRAALPVRAPSFVS